MQPKLWNVPAIDFNGATGGLNNAEKRERQRRLSSSSSTHDTNLSWISFNEVADYFN